MNSYPAALYSTPKTLFSITQLSSHDSSRSVLDHFNCLRTIRIPFPQPPEGEMYVQATARLSRRARRGKHRTRNPGTQVNCGQTISCVSLGLEEEGETQTNHATNHHQPCPKNRLTRQDLRARSAEPLHLPVPVIPLIRHAGLRARGGRRWGGLTLTGPSACQNPP